MTVFYFPFDRGLFCIKLRDHQTPRQEAHQRSLATRDYPPRRQHPFARSGFGSGKSDRRSSWCLRNYPVLLSLQGDQDLCTGGRTRSCESNFKGDYASQRSDR